MADDAEECPVTYGPTPGRERRPLSPTELRAELVYIEAEIDAWARKAFGASDDPPEALFRRKFEICQELGLQIICR